MAKFDGARERYAKLGVDMDKAIDLALSIPISMHCWQGDDVIGFDSVGGSLSGGIQTTGNYPGRATTPEQLMADFDEASSLVPGKKRLNLHASYAIFGDGKWVDRDEIEPKHFAPWVEFAKERGLGLDFNPTYFSHPKAEKATLSSVDEETRQFWIRHGIASRRIGQYFADELGTYCLVNQWTPDGMKDVPADRLSPRLRQKDSLDKIFAEKLPGVVDCVESKVFGIGFEAYTVGSNEFYMSYAGTHPGVYNLLDTGHYHPTEVVSDKIPALLAYFDKVPLHVSRPVRWDSDHVVRFDDELKEIACEIIRNNATDRVLIGLDFFDASINRIAAWVIGTRNMRKALLYAALLPNDYLRKLQDEGNGTELLMLQEECKLLPLGEAWEALCERENMVPDERWLDEVRIYEKKVLEERK